MTVQLDIGSWGVFCGPEGRQLVLVDEHPCGPVSARKITRAIPRRLLLDESRVSTVMASGEPQVELVDSGSGQWVVTLRPVITPRTDTVIAVMAHVSEPGRKVPEPPLLGAWEWEIERDENGQPTPRRRAYGGGDLFVLYGVDEDVAANHPGEWDVSEWANELIDQTDQMRVNSSIRDGIKDGLAGNVGVVRCLTTTVATGYGSASRGRRHLRLVGQIRPIGADDDVIIMQGFSYEAPESFQDFALTTDAARVDDVLRGVLELSEDPMAVVDVSTLDVLMSSPSWRREDFGHVGGLGECVSDPSELYRYLDDVVEQNGASDEIRMEILRADSTVREVGLSATSVRSGGGSPDIVVKLRL